jgi:hypothetical protein
VLRIQGILMSLEGVTAGEISNYLKVHRSTVPLWIDHWNRHGRKGLWEGHRSGRPRGLSPEEREKLCDILAIAGRPLTAWKPGFGPVRGCAKSSPRSSDKQYHPGHVRKLLQQLVPISSSTANGCATPTRI